MEKNQVYSYNFSKSFENLLSTGDLSDVIVICDNKTYKLHRILLSINSEFFNTCFHSNFPENEQNRIYLKVFF